MIARRLAGTFVLCLALGGCIAPVSDSELARRVESARPQWQSYQEDVKAQLGAGPVAEWSGEPVEAAVSGSELALTFRVEGKWASRDILIPILLRDPLGRVHRPAGSARQGGGAVYRFSLGEGASETVLPWAEVKFPGGERRLIFDESGGWRRSR